MPDSETLERWISCVGREVGLRTNLYPKWIKEGRMTPEDASRERQTMGEVYEYLKGLRKDY